MYKKTLWIAALAFSLVLSQSALADSWGCGEGMKTMLESMKLDDAQKAKIKPILEQLKSSMKENGSKMEGMDTKLNQEAESDKMTQATVEDLVNKKSALIGNMMKAKVMATNQIFMILNAQQKTDLHNMMKKLEEKISAKYKSCHEQD